MFLSTAKVPETTQVVTDTFLGLDRRLKIADGSWSEEENLSALHTPVLSVRPARKKIADLTAPAGLCTRDALAYVDGASVVLNGYAVDLGLSTAENAVPKQLVSMGAYLVIFPDKKYVNTQDLTDYGSLDASFASGSAVTYSLCSRDGGSYGTPTLSDTAPENPENGALWIDTSASPHVLSQYGDSQWITLSTVCVKLACTGIGAPFSVGDGVTLSGCAGSAQLLDLNGTAVILEKDDDFLVISGILDAAYTQSDGTVTVQRKAPDMDYVTECGNRLWGCKYGMVDGEPINELYCCKLGDFRNFRVYAGLSTDAWAASRGADGPFTGAATYLGCPVFFRERSVETVYPAANGAHQVVTTQLPGVKKGCSRSLQIVENTLFYLSPDGVCAYTGSLPEVVSGALGQTVLADGRAGVLGDTYYLSAMEDDAFTLLTYSQKSGVWHRETALKAMAFTACDSVLYCIDEENAALLALSGGTDAVPWSCVSGVIGFAQQGNSYLSRFRIRVKLQESAALTVSLQYDDSGVWETAGTASGAKLQTFLFSVIPRRCDHLRLKLSGTGDCRIYSIAAIRERGETL